MRAPQRCGALAQQARTRCIAYCRQGFGLPSCPDIARRCVGRDRLPCRTPAQPHRRVPVAVPPESSLVLRFEAEAAPPVVHLDQPQHDARELRLTRRVWIPMHLGLEVDLLADEACLRQYLRTASAPPIR